MELIGKRMEQNILNYFGNNEITKGCVKLKVLHSLLTNPVLKPPPPEYNYL